MKGIRRGSTPPVGQKVRDSLLISQHVFDGVYREQIRTVRSLSRNGVQRGDKARPLNTLQVRGAVPFQAHNLKTQVRILHLHPKPNLLSNEPASMVGASRSKVNICPIDGSDGFGVALQAELCKSGAGRHMEKHSP